MNFYCFEKLKQAKLLDFDKFLFENALFISCFNFKVFCVVHDFSHVRSPSSVRFSIEIIVYNVIALDCGKKTIKKNSESAIHRYNGMVKYFTIPCQIRNAMLCCHFPLLK